MLPNPGALQEMGLQPEHNLGGNFGDAAAVTCICVMF